MTHSEHMSREFTRHGRRADGCGHSTYLRSDAEVVAVPSRLLARGATAIHGTSSSSAGWIA